MLLFRVFIMLSIQHLINNVAEQSSRDSTEVGGWLLSNWDAPALELEQKLKQAS